VVPATTLDEWEALRAELLAEYGAQGVVAWRTRYAREAEMLRQMRDAGVGILAGTDASDEPFVYPGSSLHDELALLVEAGLTPLQALQAATLNVGLFLEREDIGTVEAGKLADLVLLDADPLSDIRNTVRIRAVIHRGRLLARPQLDSLIGLAQVRARN
jgi:imidazolonepropionase-like amidohydrolase